MHSPSDKMALTLMFVSNTAGKWGKLAIPLSNLNLVLCGLFFFFSKKLQFVFICVNLFQYDKINWCKPMI